LQLSLPVLLCCTWDSPEDISLPLSFLPRSRSPFAACAPFVPAPPDAKGVFLPKPGYTPSPLVYAIRLWHYAACLLSSSGAPAATVCLHLSQSQCGYPIFSGFFILLFVMDVYGYYGAALPLLDPFMFILVDAIRLVLTRSEVPILGGLLGDCPSTVNHVLRRSRWPGSLSAPTVLAFGQVSQALPGPHLYYFATSAAAGSQRAPPTSPLYC